MCLLVVISCYQTQTSLLASNQKTNMEQINCPKCNKDVFMIEIGKKSIYIDKQIVEVWINYQNMWSLKEGYKEHQCG